MANVTIDSGPVDASDFLHNVPQDKWFNLMQERKNFLAVRLPYDCRSLLQFTEDGEQMYGPLGFESVEDFIARGLELDPQDVAWAIEGLHRMKPDEPIPYEKAKALGKHGGVRIKGEQDRNPTLNKRGKDYDLARLDRDGFTKLAAKVRSGELSANAAAIEAGFRKSPPTPFEIVLKQLPKLTKPELNKLRTMLKPKKRG